MAAIPGKTWRWAGSPDHLWARHQGIAGRANTLYSALSVAAASKDGAVYRSKDKGKTWQRFDKVQVHGTIMSVALHQNDPKQVYIGARYEGEVFGTLDGGETWQSMNLPSGTKDIYSLACG